MMVGCREALPATAAREAVLSAVSSNDVTIISGGTGCGKSTQVPQFLLDTIIENDRAGHESVLCAQPRRIAAVSVAERVVMERCETSSVGYAIRMESQRSAETRLLFCTTGVLLRISRAG